MKKILLFCGTTPEEKKALLNFILEYTDGQKFRDFIFFTEITADIILEEYPEFKKEIERKREDLRWMHLRKIDLIDEVWFLKPNGESSEEWAPIIDIVRGKGIPFRIISVMPDSAWWEHLDYDKLTA